MKVIFHPEAYEEMLESARFYETKAEDLGRDFLAAVERATQRVRDFPQAGNPVQARIRRRLVSGFPFTILYEAQEDEIFIAAVMHQYRKPGYWRKRLKG